MLIQREKCLQAVEILKEENVDLWITYGMESDMNNNSMIPLVAEHNLCGAICIGQNGFIGAIGGVYAGPAYEKSGIYDTVVTTMPGSTFKDSMFKILDMVQPKNIALNYSQEMLTIDELGTGQYMMLTEIFEEWGFKGEVISAGEIMRKLRGRKSAIEIENIRKACEITEAVQQEMRNFIRVGVSEEDIYNEFVRISKEKYGDLNADTGVFVGGDFQIGHLGPGKLVAKPGDIVNLDSINFYNGYSSDLQRCYYIGGPGETEVPQHLQEAFRNLQIVIDDAVAVMLPGVPAYAVDDVSKAGMRKYGLQDIPAGFGHQVGRCTHDGGSTMGTRSPRYGKSVYYPLEVGNVFTLDQGYIGPHGFMGQEDVGVVTEGKVEWLSKRQDEIWFIPYQE